MTNLIRKRRVVTTPSHGKSQGIIQNVPLRPEEISERSIHGLAGVDSDWRSVRACGERSTKHRCCCLQTVDQGTASVSNETTSDTERRGDVAQYSVVGRESDLKVAADATDAECTVDDGVLQVLMGTLEKSLGQSISSRVCFQAYLLASVPAASGQS